MLKETRGNAGRSSSPRTSATTSPAWPDDVVFVHEGRLIEHAPTVRLLGGGRTLEQAFLERVGKAVDGRAA
ncbi:MAG: hypothetical protein IPF66_23560 [Holophagales bacterium]|nr:hypothetical protein [Holophagales bacterium]